MSQVSPTPREDQELEQLDLNLHPENSPSGLFPPKVSIAFEEAKLDLLCPICDSVLNEVNQIIIPECFHRFCNSCMTAYITLRVQDSQVSKMPCPQHTCKAEIPSDIIQAVLTPEFFEKYKKFKIIEELNRNPNLRWCPIPDCEGYDTGSMKKQKLICNNCGYNYCYYCSEAWHDGLACKGQADFILDKWSKENKVKFCPNCTRRVQKNEGCDHMTCVVCKYEWCWLCGEKYNPAHYEICKVRIMEKWNPKWYMIFLMIFCIPITPFFFAVFCCLHSQDGLPRRRCTVSEILINMCIFVFTLILTPFVYVGIMYVWMFICLKKITPRLSKYLTIKIIYGFIAIPLIPMVACMAVISLIIITIVGFCAIIVKIIFIIRRSRNPDYMRPIDYVTF